jgi:hypothetical protein
MATRFPGFELDAPPDDGQSFLEVVGLEGSRLRITERGLTVLPCRDGASDLSSEGRFWSYGLIKDVRLEEYGPLGVVRARVRSTGDDVPLLLIEPEEITPARRALEMVWNMMSAATDRRLDA